MAALEDVKAAQDALAKVASDLEAPGEPEHGTYTITPTATGYTIELTKGEPPAAPAEPPLPPQNE